MSAPWGRLSPEQAKLLGAKLTGGVGYIMLGRFVGIFFNLPKRYQKQDEERVSVSEMFPEQQGESK